MPGVEGVDPAPDRWPLVRRTLEDPLLDVSQRIGVRGSLDLRTSSEWDDAMSIPERDHLPIACTLDGGDGIARMRRWQALADRAHPRTTRDAGTLEVRFEPVLGALAELVSLAAAEQECCGFVTWTVYDHANGPVLLVTAEPGRPDDVAPIAAMFNVE